MSASIIIVSEATKTITLSASTVTTTAGQSSTIISTITSIATALTTVTATLTPDNGIVLSTTGEIIIAVAFTVLISVIGGISARYTQVNRQLQNKKLIKDLQEITTET